MTKNGSLDFRNIKSTPGYIMPRAQRMQLLRDWANSSRTGASDIVAKVALDEIEELHLQIKSLNMELERAKAAGFRG